MLLTWRNSGVSDAGNARAFLFLTDWGKLLKLGFVPCLQTLYSYPNFAVALLCEVCEVEGLMVYVRSWRHSCRGLFLLMLSSCSLGKGCAVAGDSTSAPLLAVWALDLQCSLICHTESRALSYLGLGFSPGFLWLPTGKCFLTCIWSYGCRLWRCMNVLEGFQDLLFCI